MAVLTAAPPARPWWASPWFKVGLSLALLLVLLWRTDLSDLRSVVAHAHGG